MPVETPSLFSKIIQDHLDLKQRNAGLESSMPLRRYKSADPFDNHPLFKTEEQARLEETLDGEVSISDEPATVAWPGDGLPVEAPELETGLWSRSRDFDWGD